MKYSSLLSEIHKSTDNSLFSVTHLREYRRTRKSCGVLRDTRSSMTTIGGFRPLLTSYFFLTAFFVVQLEKSVVYNNANVRL